MKKINTYTVTYKLMRKQLYVEFGLQSWDAYDPDEVRAYINEYIHISLRKKLLKQLIIRTVIVSACITTALIAYLVR